MTQTYPVIISGFLLEYSVIMFDGITGEKRWNVTFFDYASQPAKENEHGSLLFDNFVVNWNPDRSIRRKTTNIFSSDMHFN